MKYNPLKSGDRIAFADSFSSTFFLNATQNDTKQTVFVSNTNTHTWHRSTQVYYTHRLLIKRVRKTNEQLRKIKLTRCLRSQNSTQIYNKLNEKQQNMEGNVEFMMNEKMKICVGAPKMVKMCNIGNSSQPNGSSNS